MNSKAETWYEAQHTNLDLEWIPTYPNKYETVKEAWDMNNRFMLANYSIHPSYNYRVVMKTVLSTVIE